MGGHGFRIAVIGCRGIPAGYSGFETFAEELCTRLVTLGHDVTVYCRRGAQYTNETDLDEYKGVKLVYTPYVKQRELETLSHEAASILESLRRPFDLYYFLGTRSSPLYIPLRLSRRRTVVIATNGLEWKRTKWSPMGRRYLRMAERVAVRLASDELVSDGKAMQAYYKRTYGVSPEYIPNGAYVLRDVPADDPDEFGVEAGSYYLIACRIEPENNIHVVIREFIESGSDKELVIAGGMNYETPYWTELQDLAAGHRVRFLGPVYGPMRVERLHLGCYAYLHPHEVGGTNPSLLKAMGAANCAIALDTEFNAENLGGTGVLWKKDPGSLAGQIRWADAHPDEVRELGRKAQARVAAHYTWDHVAAEHDRFFRQVMAARR